MPIFLINNAAQYVYVSNIVRRMHKHGLEGIKHRLDTIKHRGGSREPIESLHLGMRTNREPMESFCACADCYYYTIPTVLE